MKYEVLQGDTIEVMKTLKAETFDMCVTSPPYYGLRDYGTAKWEGGNPECEHKKPMQSTRGGPKSTITGGQDTSAHEMNYKSVCKKCGATRKDKQIGLEQTPEDYVNKLVDVFREVKRVLRDDGVVFLNLGDSYYGSGKGGQSKEKRSKNWQPAYPHLNVRHEDIYDTSEPCLKPKDLIGIPWRVAFALQADGWYLRSDIIWHKPNPMPESVKDRPTKSHEYIFLLSNKGKYYYDYESIMEIAAYDGRKDTKFKGATKSYNGVMPDGQPQSFAQDGHERWPSKKNGVPMRNKRTVWTVATKPFKEAHFATFPPKLITPCILAGSRKEGRVLDPFCGSGTTGVVCSKYERDFTGIELNPEYVEMAKNRIFKANQQMRLYD